MNKRTIIDLHPKGNHASIISIDLAKFIHDEYENEYSFGIHEFQETLDDAFFKNNKDKFISKKEYIKKDYKEAGQLLYMWIYGKENTNK